MIKVPFTLPAKCKDDVENILTSVQSGKVVGDGPFTKKVESLLTDKFFGKSKVLLTTSCTHALEMAAILLEISPGDEVIVPSYTFVSSALAFHMRGAQIVFADIREDTLNIDTLKLEHLITNRTRAIVAVHYGGIACEMDELMQIARKFNLRVIEDNAHGPFGKYRGRDLGSIGDIGTQSFHGTKNISCGEGGAIVLNDKSFSEQADIVREKGTNRAGFLKGEVDKYTWVSKGSSYVMSDILAALLYSQLIEADIIQHKRKEIWNTYNGELARWASCSGVCIPFVPEYCSQSFHLFFLIFSNTNVRDRFITFMRDRNIVVASHYQPLHRSKFMKQNSVSEFDPCPVATQTSDCLVRLPLFPDMSDDQLEYVVQSVREFEV